MDFEQIVNTNTDISHPAFSIIFDYNKQLKKK